MFTKNGVMVHGYLHDDRDYPLSYPLIFDLLVTLQSGRCAICLDPSWKLLVDHCHSTGAVKGAPLHPLQ